MIGSIDLNHHKVGKNETPKAPGMKYKHYAPKAQVYIVDEDTDWDKVVEWIRQQPFDVGMMAEEKVLQQRSIADERYSISLGKNVQDASALVYLMAYGNLMTSLMLKRLSLKHFQLMI